MLRVAIVVLCSICLMYSHDEIDAQSDTSDITNGKIAFASNRDGNYEIYTMASDGSDVQRLTFNEGGDFDPDWSPDGTKIAFSSQQDIVSDIIIMDSDGSNQINLTNNPDGGDLYPSWSPDGTKIAFSRTEGDSSDIYIINVDGSGLTKVVDGGGLVHNFMATWSPDGSELMYTTSDDIPRVSFTVTYIEKVHADGTSQTRPGAGGISTYGNLDWSPANNQVAFYDAGLHIVIYTMDDDLNNIKPVTSVPVNESQSHKNPSWSPDANRIAYEGKIFNQPGVSADSDIYVVDVATGQSTNITPNSIVCK
ncbi:MAG: hypothetical protein AAFV33_08445 [Chloroflexota bacterium]